jgi:O-antigen ligase
LIINILTVLTWLIQLPDSLLGCATATLLLIAVIVIRTFSKSSPVLSVHLSDTAIVVYVSIQFATIAVTRSRPNTIHFILPIVSAMCGYYITRLHVTSYNRLLSLIRFSAAFSLLLSLSDLYIIGSSLKGMRLFAGFNIAALHAYLPLLGGSTRNDCIMLLLALYPFSICSWIMERQRNRVFYLLSYITVASVSTSLVLCFSRSAYIALLVFLSIAGVILRRSDHINRRASYILVVLTALTAGSVISYFRASGAIAEVMYMNKTPSQQRSTMGRITIWKASWRDIIKHPFIGIGGGLDGYTSLTRLGTEPDMPFVARAYNTPVEILLSSGIIGLAIYLTIVISPLRQFIVRRFITPTNNLAVDALAPPLAAGLIAIALRDMTYTSIVLDGPTMIVAWVLIAALINCVTIPELGGLSS